MSSSTPSPRPRPRLPYMGKQIIPRFDVTKRNMKQQPWLIKPDMPARRKSELSYLPMQKTAMPEVKAGQNQCFHCGLFGHLFGDCPDKYRPKEGEDFKDWRLIKNGKYYSVLALWPGEWWERELEASDLGLTPLPEESSPAPAFTLTENYGCRSQATTAISRDKTAVGMLNSLQTQSTLVTPPSTSQVMEGTPIESTVGGSQPTIHGSKVL
ncbi:hypothetical protein DFH28DRAFT_933854 [Melampsora americana]|nr:hypothetical protein DFH28DRAFT_933854 [Melampsora americana]